MLEGDRKKQLAKEAAELKTFRSVEEGGGSSSPPVSPHTAASTAAAANYSSSLFIDVAADHDDAVITNRPNSVSVAPSASSPPPVTVTGSKCGGRRGIMECKKRNVVIIGVLSLVGLIILLLGISIEKLEVYEVGIKYQTLSKTLGSEPQTEGLYIGEPGFEFVIFPRVFTSLEWNDFLCINNDGVDIVVRIRFQYKVQEKYLREIILEFKDYDGYLEMVRNLAGVVIHNTCGLFDTDQLQTNRSSFQHFMRGMMVEKLDEELHTDITDLQVDNIQRPHEYEEAIRDKEAAKENVQLALNERPRLLTAANTTREQALFDANIMHNKAAADARAILAKGEADAEGILYSYRQETQAYRYLMDSLGLTVEGLLSYISSQAISRHTSPGPIVNIDPPADTRAIL